MKNCWKNIKVHAEPLGVQITFSTALLEELLRHVSKKSGWFVDGSNSIFFDKKNVPSTSSFS
jgi:hypothetical protein